MENFYIPIKLCKTVGSIHFFKITKLLMPDKIKLSKYYTLDILETDWQEVNVTFNGNMIDLPFPSLRF